MSSVERLGELNGQAALVTGANGGIGQAIAVELGKAGAYVAAAARTPEGADEALQTINEHDLLGSVAVIDLSRPQTFPEVIEIINQDLGDRPLSILVNNGGITRDGLEARMPAEDWEDVINIDLSAAHFMTQAVLRGMMKRRYGRIIHTGSVSGLRGNPGQTNYAAAKAGLIGLAKSQAKELASRNITVNVVAPGYVKTKMTEVLPPEATQTMIEHTPIGRPVTPEEVAYAVRFLASPRAGAITGEVLRVDGGLGA